MDIITTMAALAASGAAGVCFTCWRLRDRAAGAASFMANLRAVLRTGGQGEER